MQALFEKYGLNYCTRPIVPQVYSAWHRVVRLSLPNGWLQTTKVSNAPEQLAKLYKMATGTPKERRALQARLIQEARRAEAARVAA